MSFWSSLELIRTGPPPEVTTNQIADFVKNLNQFDFIGHVNSYTLSLQYGSLKELAHSIEIGSRTVEFHVEAEWDSEQCFDSIEKIIDALMKKDRDIAQGFISLGCVPQYVFDATVISR